MHIKATGTIKNNGVYYSPGQTLEVSEATAKYLIGLNVAIATETQKRVEAPKVEAPPAPPVPKVETPPEAPKAPAPKVSTPAPKVQPKQQPKAQPKGK